MLGALLVGALILAVLLGPHLPAVRSSVLTVALVPELINLPIRPLSAATAEPVRISTTYGTPADRMDIYLPAGATEGARLPGVVLALGVHPQPIDHPDVTGIASSISRIGVVVGVPDSTALRNLVLTAAEPAHLADAALVLSSRPEVDPARVGLAGFSAGASIALIAAADERIAEELSFVSAFGGYADAEELLVDVATNSAVVDGSIREWPADTGIRTDIAQLLTGAGESDVDSIATGRLLSATDRHAAQDAVATLSPGLRAQLRALSPVNFAGKIEAPVFILHGERDTAIPVGHAATLASAIGDEVVRVTRFGRFGHGQPGASGLGIDDAGDILALSVYLRDIVAAATE